MHKRHQAGDVGWVEYNYDESRIRRIRRNVLSELCGYFRIATEQILARHPITAWRTTRTQDERGISQRLSHISCPSYNGIRKPTVVNLSRGTLKTLGEWIVHRDAARRPSRQ
jgi:hypothetical protein